MVGGVQIHPQHSKERKMHDNILDIVRQENLVGGGVSTEVYRLKNKCYCFTPRYDVYGAVKVSFYNMCTGLAHRNLPVMEYLGEYDTYRKSMRPQREIYTKAVHVTEFLPERVYVGENELFDEMVREITGIERSKVERVTMNIQNVIHNDKYRCYRQEFGCLEFVRKYAARSVSKGIKLAYDLDNKNSNNGEPYYNNIMRRKNGEVVFIDPVTPIKCPKAFMW